MISITTLQPDEVEENLARDFQCAGGKAALAGAVAAENMRALIYGAAVAKRDVGADRTVHTTRLMISARRVVELSWPQRTNRTTVDATATTPDLCSDILQRMGTLGDAVDTGGGQWLAAPMRIIATEPRSHFLLIGAAPAKAAQQRLGVIPACAGASRFVGGAVLDSVGNDDVLQSVDTWLGSMTPIAGWTLQLLASHEAGMKTVEGLSAEQLEIYSPDVARTQRRTGRWVPAGQIGRPLDGVRLCRPLERYAQSWNRPRYLAYFDFKEGALSLRRAASLRRELALRLCFGLDLMLQTPRQFFIVRQRETFSIDRPHALPEPESRIYALGWHDYAEQERADRLTFQSSALPFVMHAFQRLSINPTITPRDAS